MQGQCMLCGRQAQWLATQVMVDGVPIELCGQDLGLPLSVILLNLQQMARGRAARMEADTSVPPPITPSG